MALAADLRAMDAAIFKNKNRRYPLEGAKNISTDIVGHTAFEDLKKRYIGRPLGDRKMLRYEMAKLYDELRKQGRLFRRDGTRI